MVSPTEKAFLINKRVVLVRMGGEIGIKSRQTRRRMVNILKHNIKTILAKLSGYRIIDFRDRLIIYHESNTDLNEVAQLIVNSISGISSVSIANVVQATEAALISGGLSEAIAIIQPNKSFAVRVRREGNHPYSSMDIARKIGAKILASQLVGIRVDLEDPDHEISLDIRGSLAFIYSNTLRGMDGIPSHSQGTTLALIRPNLNSIIAAWLMKKRGVDIIPVFFRTGKPSEEEFNNYLQSEFTNTPIDISIEDLLKTFKSNSSLCLLCTIFCEQVCQKLASKKQISAIVSPTCFDYNDETISLEALKILEKRAFLSVLRPIQFGFFSQGLIMEYLDHKSCCHHRSKVSLQILEDFNETVLNTFLSFNSKS